jgi:glycerophosphoryl diester phosphodiesterase
VAIHDPHLDRVSDRTGLVRELTWRQLSEVRLTPTGGPTPNPASGSTDPAGEPIPRLDELLAAWPDLRWNIDAKHESAIDPLIETLQKSAAIDRVCVTSFSDRRLTRIRRALGPRLCTAMGPAAVVALRLASVLPAAASAPATAPLGRFGAAQVPIRQGGMPLVDRRFVETAHRAGLHVHVWTIDDETTMARLLDLGVDGIMTDRPTVLKALLERRQAWN